MPWKKGESGTPSGRKKPLGLFICVTTSGFTHVQFFISSFVKAHCVRLRSGRFANGQVAISSPLSLAATARRVCKFLVKYLKKSVASQLSPIVLRSHSG